MNIPLKITGTVHKPRYSVTGAAVSKLVDNLLQQGLKSILDIPEKKKKEPVNDGTVITDETAPAASTSKPITDEHTDTVTQKKGELSRDALIEDTLRRGLDLLLKEKSE